MPTANTYVRSACVASQSADGRRRASSGFRLGHVLLLTIGAYLCFGLRLFAQTSDSRTAEEPTKSWTATTDSTNDNLKPTRTTETHLQNGNRTLDERSVQIPGSGGHFEPYQDIEKETLQVDATTVRSTTRTFARDVNGMKALVQVTEEEKHTLPGGDSNVISITSSPDVNGNLQPVEREIAETKRISTDVDETKTTVMHPSVNGGLAPVLKTDEFRRRVANDTAESQTTTLLPDGAGNWQVSEVRQATTRREGTNRTTEERVSRLDSEGKLGEVSRVVSHESESTSGEKRSVVETYSIDVPGTTPDGSLHLVERKTSTESSTSTGERATEQKVEQTNPGDPGSGLRVSVLVDGRMLPGPSGEQSTVTIRARDVNGSFGIVSVDTTKADRVPTIQVQQTPAEKP
jgi:hypothetical protein